MHWNIVTLGCDELFEFVTSSSHFSFYNAMCLFKNTFPFWKHQIGHPINACVTKSQYFEKSFFSRLLPPRYAFAVAPLCLHFFISVQAKEERSTPNPSLGRGEAHPQPLPGEGSCMWIFAYLQLWLFFCIAKTFTKRRSTSRRHLEGISNTCRRKRRGE